MKQTFLSSQGEKNINSNIQMEKWNKTVYQTKEVYSASWNACSIWVRYVVIFNRQREDVEAIEYESEASALRLL